MASNDRDGLKTAVRERRSPARHGAARNTLDPAPRQRDDDCLHALRRIDARCDLKKAQFDLSACLERWWTGYPMLTDWVDVNMAQTLTVSMLPRHGPDKEIRHRTRVVRIEPNQESCWRLVRAAGAETHNARLQDNRFVRSLG